MRNATRGGIVFGLLLSLSILAAAQDEPPLPPGLGDPPPSQQTDEPALPPGLGGETQPSTEPALPPGLEADVANPQPTDGDERQSWAEALNLTGFWEVRGGVRTQRDRHEHQASIGETRLQLEYEQLYWQAVNVKVVADLVYDQIADRHGVNLESGAGFLDLREACFTFSPADFVDIRIGRQILTWGTGDLLFLNDAFPKDWQSFFAGRDVEYLKAPSDAIKLSLFSDLANWDIVYTPRFDPDRYISGQRLSYYSPFVGGRAGYNLEQHPNVPNEWFRDSEWATRVWKNVNGYELAAYGYWGYWKSPTSIELPSLQAGFPRLSIYGGSVRGAVGRGVGNLEFAYYDSREDRAGNNRLVNNSELRFLAGYSRQLPEIAEDLTVGGQYYLEWMMDYDAYRDTLLPIMPARDELRHVVTLRVTKLFLNQNLELSLFAYYSPSDSDAYLRPHVAYKLDDHWRVELGGNVFFGAQPYTFFNQFADNTNVYAALRYSF